VPHQISPVFSSLVQCHTKPHLYCPLLFSVTPNGVVTLRVREVQVKTWPAGLRSWFRFLFHYSRQVYSLN
jgi:hypothetical protein